MAVIIATEAATEGAFPVFGTVLSGSDTLTLEPSRRQLLLLRNPTAGELTATLTGTLDALVEVEGVGEVDLSGGYALTVPAGEGRAVVLSTVSAYCRGGATLTGGAGLVAQLLQASGPRSHADRQLAILLDRAIAALP